MQSAVEQVLSRHRDREHDDVISNDSNNTETTNNGDVIHVIANDTTDSAVLVGNDDVINKPDTNDILPEDDSNAGGAKAIQEETEEMHREISSEVKNGGMESSKPKNGDEVMSSSMESQSDQDASDTADSTTPSALLSAIQHGYGGLRAQSKFQEQVWRATK